MRKEKDADKEIKKVEYRKRNTKRGAQKKGKRNTKKGKERNAKNKRQ